jgi:hypothetical protein
MADEFCPLCGEPLDTSGDESRLCYTCGWFGDNTETRRAPWDPKVCNPIGNLVQALSLYRELCRQELLGEQFANATIPTNAAHSRELHQVKTRVREGLHSLIELFIVTYQLTPPAILKKDEKSGMVPWPDSWTVRRYNACNEPCDMLVGPCACGGWHDEQEQWVQDVLKLHNAVIQ